ncbi:MAG: hypothetical protein AMXMBFR7_33840 [Planctomycetota bacterium]
MIELIIWLVKALSNAQEPPSQMGPRSNRTEGGGRGPYDYGDGRNPPAGTRPKTLAELLEEARQQQGGSRPAAPREEVAPAPPPRPAVPTPQPVVRAPEPERAAPVMVMPQSPASTIKPVQAIRPVEKVTDLSAKPPTVASADTSDAKRRTAKRRKRQQASVSPVRSQPALQNKQNQTNPAQAYVDPRRDIVSPALQVRPWIREFHRARGEDRAVLTAQAIMAMEILGPPRAIRPYKPGSHWAR